jgi:hypothetical protein
MDVRHPAARVDPHLDVQHLAAVLVDRPPEAQPLPERRILDHLLVHASSFQR